MRSNKKSITSIKDFMCECGCINYEVISNKAINFVRFNNRDINNGCYANVY